MSNLVLGVGDYGATKTPDSTIKTYALGSCVAVIILDPKIRAVGMAHIALPESKINADKARDLPGYFADTGIPALLREMTRLGCQVKGRGLIVKLAGGAKVLDNNDTFNIGKRNQLAIKKILWAHGLGPIAEDLGGNFSRTVTVSTSTGEITISCPGRGQWTL